MKISVRTAEEKPDYKKTAAALLERCREFYQDAENEQAFREWMKDRRKEAG